MRGGSVLAKCSVLVTPSVVDLPPSDLREDPIKDIQRLRKAGPHLTRARWQQLQLSLSSSRFSLCGPQTYRSVYDPELGILDLEIITCDDMQVQLC